MMENYRSTPEILAAVNHLIAKNRNRIEKELVPMLPTGPKPLYHHAAGADGEGHWLANEVKRLRED